MGREFEIKMQADAAQLEAVQKAYGDFETIRMETTYYDTPSRALGALRWTLRRRLENGVWVCTMKTKLLDGGRGEWELKCDDIREAIPQLVAQGAPAELVSLTAEGLVPTCGARFTRLAKQVETGNSVVEIALDQGVLLGGRKELPFAEIEVELKSGSDAEAVAFAEALSAHFGLVPQTKSKFRRALELAQKMNQDCSIKVTEEELIAYIKPRLKANGFRKKGKRWTKATEHFTYLFFIQGSSYDKETYYVRPGVIVNAIPADALCNYGHMFIDVPITTAEEILASAEAFFAEWSDMEHLVNAVLEFCEWETRNPVENRRAGLVDYEKDPVLRRELFTLSARSKEQILHLNES